MDVLGDLVSRDHATGDDRLALRAPGAPPRSYSYREFGTTARKTGNFLRHLGVREGAVVGVTDDATPESLLSLFGVALLGGTVWFGPPAELDARALVAPVGRLRTTRCRRASSTSSTATPPTTRRWRTSSARSGARTRGSPTCRSTPSRPS
ncbi:AMP-binding protein [Halobacteriaceae archaeon GCM10025711]